MKNTYTLEDYTLTSLSKDGKNTISINLIARQVDEELLLQKHIFISGINQAEIFASKILEYINNIKKDNKIKQEFKVCQIVITKNNIPARIIGIDIDNNSCFVREISTGENFFYDMESLRLATKVELELLGLKEVAE